MVRRTEATLKTDSPWHYLRPYRSKVVLGSVMLLATNLCFVGIPVTTGMTIEALKAGRTDDVTRLVLWMVGFAILTAITRIVSRVTIFNAARAAEYDLRSDLFGHLLRLEPAYYREHPTGDVMTRLTSDVTTVRAMWGAGILNVLNTGFVFIPVLVMMVRVDPVLTMWAIVPYPTIFFLGRAMGRRIYRASQGSQAQLSVLSNGIQEDLTGIQVIKSYGIEDLRRVEFRKKSETLLARNMDLVKVRGQMGPALAAAGSLAVVIVLYVGGLEVLDGKIALGQLVEFNGYLARLAWPTLALGWMLQLIERGRASWNRLAAILDRPPAIDDGAGVTPMPDVTGDMRVSGLTIEIDGRKILDAVNLHLRPGTVTAIVGRTGSGKSTLVDCLTRLLVVPRGTIFLDGRDVLDVPLETLRASIGYAPQEAFLFSTTIADNIAFGYGEGATLARYALAGPPSERVVRASEAAGLARDLAALPEGYATVVGERGITLSGGQRQRVALARALASAPKILILDDSLSSVDAETERLILDRLDQVMHGRTAVIISHRVAAVQKADEIVVLDDGKVVDRGTHAELLAHGGLYAELYKVQLEAAGDGVAASAERERLDAGATPVARGRAAEPRNKDGAA